MNLTLVQCRWSHYNEKARWALDYKGTAHARRTLLPGLHAKETIRLTGQTQLPILIVDGEATHDSSQIIERLERLHQDPPLCPVDPAQAAATTVADQSKAGGLRLRMP